MKVAHQQEDHYSTFHKTPSRKDDCAKTGKVTSAGMFFLGFPVYRFDQTNTPAASKDPDAAFFKKLDGFQPCEINELKAGTHVFAVYGDNFFRSVNYTIEVMCAEPFTEEKDQLRDVEARLLTKRVELSKFEIEYREIDELLKERNAIHGSYATSPPLKRSSSSSRIRTSFKGCRSEGDDESREKSRDRPKRKKWFNIHLKSERRKQCWQWRG